jgi:hypothetical protein
MNRKLLDLNLIKVLNLKNLEVLESQLHRLNNNVQVIYG